MHVVPMVQRCNNDLIGVGAQVDVEKDEMLERVTWGNAIVSRLKPLNEWADITDPASGYPIHSQPGASPYPDVQGTQTLLRYDTQSTGCCHVLLHPSWGSSIYPATLFTSADPETFARVVGEVEREAQVGEDELESGGEGKLGDLSHNSNTLAFVKGWDIARLA
ncbi:hypothetical protein BC938DRAFT_484259, partial [Jimgerdemannia flammicorona]